jgi:hypothetical protein
MTPPLKLDLDGSITVSATQLERMQTCPAFWSYNYLWRRVLRAAPAARAGGKAFDAALREWHGGRGMDAAVAALHAAYEGVEIAEGEYRTPARFEEVLRLYAAHWQPEQWHVVGQQLQLTVDLGPLVRYRLIPDRLVRVDGELWVVDDKTSNRWDGQRLISYENSGQAKGYVWALQRLIADGRIDGVAPTEPLAGFMLNAIVVREPYKSEAGRKANRVPREEFHRVPFRYEQERLEEWRDDALMWVRQAIQWHRWDHFPQSEKHCSHHYGKTCPYLIVCKSPKEQRPLVLGMDMFEDYGEGPWAGAVEDVEEG